MKSKARKYAVNQIAESLHIGNMLHTYFDKKRIHKSALARKLDRRPATLYRFEANATIQTAILWEICHALKHNFFDDIASTLPVEFTSNALQQNELEAKALALEAELKQARIERDLLLKIVGKLG